MRSFTSKVFQKIKKDESMNNRSSEQIKKKLLKRKDEIIVNHRKYMERERLNAPNKPLTEALADVLDIDNCELPCLECHL